MIIFSVLRLVIVMMIVSLPELARGDEQTRCDSQIERAVKQLNILYLNHHLDSIPLASHSYPFSLYYDPWRQLKIRQYWLGEDIGMQCIPETGELVDFLRTDIASRPIFLSQEPSPTWDTAYLISQTKPWIEAVLNYFPTNLGVPKASFTANIRDEKRFYNGEWSIRWPRIDSQHHTFESDDLAVIMSEKYGLVGCRLNFDSNFHEFNGKVISKEAALSIATAPATTLLGMHNLLISIPPGCQLGTIKAELSVANPNNIFQCQSMNQFKKSLNCRLAWAVIYSLNNQDASNSGHLLIIKIDAENGQVLGGDFQ